MSVELKLFLTFARSGLFVYGERGLLVHYGGPRADEQKLRFFDNYCRLQITISIQIRYVVFEIKTRVQTYTPPELLVNFVYFAKIMNTISPNTITQRGKK